MRIARLVARARLVAVVCGAVATSSAAWPAFAQDGGSRPPLEVLRETGSTRDGVPVYEPHPDGARYVADLSRGFSAHLLRLYALEQHYLQATRGSEPEPAYLLVSTHMGGFPRFGFYLGARDKRAAGYVDLVAARRVGGRFGAMDQIFPHELGHVMMVQLAGPPRKGGSNQMHAIGVRTDPANAFSEGFAEHFQVMALDDPDALPETRELLHDDFFARRTSMQLREYAREMEAAWPPMGRRRAAFPLWFSGSEQALRYFAVKSNLFARQPRIPDRLRRRAPYAAYLLENILPGAPSATPKSAAQMASTEGVIAALFLRWATDPELQAIRRDAGFYAPWGTTAESVTPIENVYLKMFYSFGVARPGTVHEAIAGYKRCFPDEAQALDRVVTAITLGQPFQPVEPIWLANPQFTVGTTVFDQFRSLPRVHVFDLNAASLDDLLLVPGVDRSLADSIRRHAPYAALDDLRSVRGMTAALVGTFRGLQQRWTRLQSNPAGEEFGLSLGALLRPFIIRLVMLLVFAAALGAAAYRLAMPRRWLRASVNGLAAAAVGFFMEAGLDLPAGLAGIVGPVLLLGVPAALFCLAFPGRTRRCLTAAGRGASAPGRLRLAAAVLCAWLLATLPLIVLMTPQF